MHANIPAAISFLLLNRVSGMAIMKLTVLCAIHTNATQEGLVSRWRLRDALSNEIQLVFHKLMPGFWRMDWKEQLHAERPCFRSCRGRSNLAIWASTLRYLSGEF